MMAYPHWRSYPVSSTLRGRCPAARPIARRGRATATLAAVLTTVSDLAQGLPASFQAPTRPGKYPYHSILQPYMTGVLTVS